MTKADVGSEARCLAKGYEDWWYGVFGAAGPLISGLVGLFVLIVVVLFLDLVEAQAGVGFVGDISGGVGLFLKANLLFLFFLMLFFGYTTYLNRMHRVEFVWAMPAVTAASVTITIWILVNIFTVITPRLGVPFFEQAVAFFDKKVLLTVFAFVLVLGYAVLYSWRFYTRSMVR